MGKNKRWAVTKFFRGYAVTIVTSLFVLAVLVLLLVARYYDLYSVRDIAKINPLITSGQNELIAAEDADGQTQVVKDDGQKTKQPGASVDTQVAPADQPAQNPQVTPDTSGSTKPSSGSSGSSSKPASKPAFSVSIKNVSQTAGSYLEEDCSTYFFATLTIQNGPGTVTYQWKRDGAASAPVTEVLDSGAKVIQMHWTPSTAGAHTVAFELLTPTRQSQEVTFQCMKTDGIGGLDDYWGGL